MIETNVKDKELGKLLPRICSHLVPGEQPVLAMKGTSFRPLTDLLVVTNARVVAFSTLKWGDGVKFEARVGQIGSVTNDGRKVVVTATAGAAMSFALGKDEARRAAEATRRLIHGAPQAEVTVELDAAHQASDALEAAWLAVRVVGESLRINKPTWKALRAAAHEDEVPLFVVSGGAGAGALAAFADRCMIVKAGVVTGFMSGSFGGSRQATFHYPQVTGIEYNAGLMNGVLEVLTASYNGSANRDFWRGTTKSRNADSNDPWTLSNTLPLSKMGYKVAQAEVNELRSMVGASHRIVVQASAAADSGSTLTGELGKLAELRTRGLLDDDEFAEAKRAVIARFA